jgi:hypothetical protein
MSISEKYLSEGDQKSLSCVVAIALGDRAAMVLQEIHFWAGVRKRERNKNYFFQGHYWMWNSYKAWQKTFPFIPEPSLKKIILGLERESVVISAEFNKNKGNRTKWYRINYEVLCKLLIPAEAIYNSYFEDDTDPLQPPCDPLQPPCDPLQPPCDPVDPLCLVINLSDQSSDQQKKESDFLENPSPEQKPDPLSDLSKPEDPKTPPLPPLSVAAQKLQEQFEGRFKNKPNRYAPQGLVEAGFGEWHLGEDYDNWRPSLIKVAQQVKRELNQPCGIKDATKYLYNTARQSRIEGHWGTFQGMTKDAIAIEQSQHLRSQQQPTPIAVQELTATAPPAHIRERFKTA